MNLFLNELSLHGQYESSGTFYEALSLIVRLKAEIEGSGDQFLCCDQLRSAHVTATTTFQTEISSLSNNAQKLAIIRWFDRSNWFNLRAHDADDEFAWEGMEVTNHSLAEAAFRLHIGDASALFGFSPSRCSNSPLAISWETPANPAILIEVDNYWSLDGLVSMLQRRQSDAREIPLQTWRQLVDWGKQYCPNLIFPDYGMCQVF